MRNFALLTICILTFAACTKKTEVTEQVNQAYSAVYSLSATGWTTSDGSLSYSTTLDVPEIDDVIQQSGGVIVYISFDNGANYEALPEVFDGIAYGAVHAKGAITIDLFAIDGGTITPPGSTILAKVVLLDAAPL